jgi:hypothetical protein
MSTMLITFTNVIGAPVRNPDGSYTLEFAFTPLSQAESEVLDMLFPDLYCAVERLLAKQLALRNLR